tara:strand:+ start:1451 stop:2062 length:612 start_codon:yes stop_codon:yes gene_type:complete
MGTHVKFDNKVLTRDANRFRKVYRYIRKKPFPIVCDDGTQVSNFVWGAYFVEFNHQHEVTHHFPCCYDAPPAVIATSVAEGSNNANFNVFVTDVTSSQCTFRTSGYYTGYVYYQAIKDGVYTMPDIGRTMEVKTLSYSNTNTNTYTFTVNSGAGFTCVPIVTATADEDVNVFITSLSKTAVTVEVSQANYTGNVYIQAIEKGC